MSMCNSPFVPVQLHHMLKLFHIAAHTVAAAAFRCNAEAGYGPLYRSEGGSKDVGVTCGAIRW